MSERGVRAGSHQNSHDMKRVQSNPERVLSKRSCKSKPNAMPAPNPTLLAVYERALSEADSKWYRDTLASHAPQYRFRASLPMAFATYGILNAVAGVIAFNGANYPGQVGVQALRSSLVAAWIGRQDSNSSYCSNCVIVELVFVLKRRTVSKHFFSELARKRWYPRVQYIEHREGYCMFGICIDPPKPANGFHTNVRDTFWERTNSHKRELQYNMLAEDKCVCRPGCSHWFRTWLPCYLLITLKLPRHIVAALTTAPQLDRMHFASVYASSCWLTAPPPKTRSLLAP